MTDTATLRALLDAATPGPWTHGPLGWEVWNRDADGAMDTRVAGSWLLPQDAALIAAAVNALPALLDVAEAARLVFDHHNCHCPGHIAIRDALDRLEADA